MKIPFDDVVTLIATLLLQSKNKQDLEEFFYHNQYHYYSFDADSDEVEEEARELGILGDDDEIIYPGDEV
jgi:hypothetical protein